MNIYVSHDTINEIIHNNVDEKNNLPLFEFLNTLCQKLNVALGNINTLEPVIDEEDVDRFTSFISTFRKVEPNRPLVVLLEDIDSIASESRYQTARLLNILDGVKQIEGVVYIATTNYPEKLQERITNRPSRFDRRYKVGSPNEEIRRAYINHKLNEEDIKGIDIDLWVKKTEGMSLSHLKEVVISVIVMGRTFEETISNLESLAEKPRIKGSGTVGFGK